MSDKEEEVKSSRGIVRQRKEHKEDKDVPTTAKSTTATAASKGKEKTVSFNKTVSTASSNESSEKIVDGIDLESITDHLHIYMAGLFDSLSYHRTIPVIVNNQEVMVIIGKIFAANAVLILGSVALFNQGILPMLQYFDQKVIEDPSSPLLNTENTSTLLFLYQLLWLTPICVLCYVLCLTWYQELADAIHKKDLLTNMNKDEIQKTRTDMKSVTKSIEYMLYGTLAWLFIFIQNQLLMSLFPFFTRTGVHIIERVLADEITIDGEVIVVSGLKKIVKLGFTSICHAGTYLSLALGLVLMAILYGWYAFDPKWIAHHMNPDERFHIIEKHLAYFIGFGTPYVLLNKCCSFFVGFGSFLMLFPFCIILGTLSDYQQPYQMQDIKPTQRYRVFKLAQVWTIHALKFFGTDIEKTQKLLEQQKQKRLLAAATATANKASHHHNTSTANNSNKKKSQ